MQWCYLKRFGQHCTRFLPVQYCPKSIKTTLNKIFFVQCCLEPFGQHCTRFLPVQCCPKSIKTTLNRIFPCNVVWTLLENIAQDFFSYFVQCCPKKIKTLKKSFLMQCCLQPQGQHYIGFFLWNIFPEVLRQHCKGFFFPLRCNVICSLLGNIAQDFYLCNVDPKVL